MNRIEQIKAEKDGLDVGDDIPRYAQLGFESIDETDLERLKWWGVFFRRHTPGYFMMRIRIPNGILTASQLRAIGWIANTFGRGTADITTRQQIQLRWITIADVPAILNCLLEVNLVTLQTGMDNIRNVIGCPVAGLTPSELFDASPTVHAFTATFLGNKNYTLHGVQTVEVGAGNGASIDFTIPEAGKFLLVDHDQLAHLADGFVIPFAGE